MNKGLHNRAKALVTWLEEHNEHQLRRTASDLHHEILQIHSQLEEMRSLLVIIAGTLNLNEEGEYYLYQKARRVIEKYE